jgi:tol-pal system protein YbgF
MQMAADLRILQQQNQELANTLAQMIQLLNDTAKSLSTRIDQTNEAIRKGFADQSLTLNATAGDVRKTLAQTQDAATRLGELKEEVEALRTSIPAMLSRLTPSPDPSFADPNAVPAGGGGPPASAQVPPSTLGLSPERMFNTAMADYGGGNYAAAIQGFQEFLKSFPTSPRADDAQYYIGDSEYLQNHLEQALAAYNLVIQNYPKGDQIAWAYYKRGQVQSRLGQTANARVSFEAVVKQFPDTEPAIMALSRLQSLDSTSPPAPARGK